MLKKSDFIVEENINIARDIYKMTLCGDTSSIERPGQFVNLSIDGLYLRRPISVCDYSSDSLVLIYKTVGKGTQIMSRAVKGDTFNLLTGLGNGFDTEKSGENPVVIGGGVGVPPMYNLAKKLLSQGKKVRAVLGFNSKEDIFYLDEFKNLGAEVALTTADGSAGIRGFVTDALKNMQNISYTYCCGPQMMLKAVYDCTQADGQYSFEERMGCGFGACMGCSCKTKYGNKRICKDGPVLEKGEIIW